MKNGNISIDTAVVTVQKGKERDYWLKQFSSVPEKVSFPYDTPGGVSTGFRAVKLEFSWQEDLFKKLLAVMKGSDYKLYMILVAGLVLLLKKYTGKNDITVGTPVLKQGIDVKFINTVLALRNHIDADMTFKDFLLQVRQTIIEGTGHQNYPVKSLLNFLNITHADREEDFPLFDTAVLLTNIHDKNYLGDIHVNTVFSFTRADNHVKAELEYNSWRYEPGTLENLMAHFACLLSDALDHPGKKLGAIEIIGEVEKKRLLLEFNDTEAEFPAGQTSGEVFTAQVQKNPGHLAALSEENQITYGELQQKAWQLAAHLKEKGVGRNDIVGLMVDRSLEMIIGILGIINAGSAYLPLDSEYPGERNLFLLKDSGVWILLCQERSIENHRDILDYLPGEHVIPIDDPATYAGKAAHPGISNYPGDPVYVIYTSGTSGVPKGVLVEHRNVLNLVFGLEKRIYYRYNQPLHICMVSPYVFDASVKQVFAALLLGHALFVVSQQTRADALRLIDYYFKHQVDISDGTPTHISLLWENLQGSGTAGASSGLFPVKRFIIGGEALSKQAAERFLKLFAANPPAITNVYGPTECSVDAASFEVSPQNLPLYPGIPIGKPMPNFRIFILDREGILQPVGISGELCIAGRGVSRGYLNRPVLTAERFCFRRPGGSFCKNRPLDPRKNFLLEGTRGLAPLSLTGPGKLKGTGKDYENYEKFLPGGPGGTVFTKRVPPGRRGQKLYQTGDLARWLPDGHLEYFGRIDRQVKIRGFRVELGEIENELLDHDAIKAAVVTVREDRDDDRVLCAYIVSASLPSANELRDFLAARVPYYLIPQYFVPLEKIPLTRNGKIDRKALPEPEIKTGQEMIAPRDTHEKKLVRTWSEVLKIEEEKISIDDDFFALGGHSLKAALMVAKVHKALDVKVPLGVVFDKPTVRALAEYIKGSSESRFTSIEPAPIKEYYALSSAQKRLYILQQMRPESTEYNLPVVMLKIEGNLEFPKLEEAFQKLVRRHESFRTCFQEVDGEPMQKIVEEIDFWIDYYTMPEAEARPLVNRYIRPFDLSKAPLLRVGLVKIAEQSCILMVDMHHIITDATSTQIFIRDLLALYAGKTLPKIPITYKDFSEWHQRLVGSGEIDKQESFWLNEFSGQLPVLSLPLDAERPPVRSFEGDTLGFQLNREIASRLREIAKINNATLYMVLLSIFYVFLHKLGGQEDIIVGTDNAGRQHADLEPVIGMFVNSFAMRNYPTPHKTFKEFLGEVKERTITSFDNQDYQFELLVEKAVSTRDPGRNPLFDVMFSYHNIAKAKADELDEKITGGLTFSRYSFEFKVSKFDLMLYGEEINENISLHFEYSTRLFNSSTIERYALYFKEIIKQLTGNSFEDLEMKLADIHLLPSPEKKQILEEFNGPEVELTRDETMVHLLEKQVQNVPDHIALEGDTLDTQTPGSTPMIHLSYREASESSGRLARLLTARGLQTESIVGIMTNRSVEMAVGILAVWKAGGVYLPIDPAYPPERIHFMLKDSRAKVLLTTHALAPEVKELSSLEGRENFEILFLETLSSSSFPVGCPGIAKNEKTGETGEYKISPYKGFPGERRGEPCVHPAFSSLAYIIYTSGTTGSPKGAMVEHTGMLNHLQAKINDIRLTGSSIVVQDASQTFDISVWQFFAAVLTGGKTIIYGNELILEPRRLLERLVRDRVTVLEVVPSYLAVILEQLPASRSGHFALFLENLVVTGETVKPHLVERWFKVYPGIRLVNAYGPTEASDDITHHIMTAPVGERRIPIGKPLQNFTLYIVDAVNHLCPIGVIGEIWVAGAGVGRGYINQPELTSEKFAQDKVVPFGQIINAFGEREAHELHELTRIGTTSNEKLLRGVQGDGFLEKSPPGRRRQKIYKTGDLGRWQPDGVIEFFGRKDQQVKIRGFRIELGEIENRLAGHPGIKEAVVVDRVEANGEKYLCAYFVGKKQTGEPGPPQVGGLQEYLAGVLPHYMIPSYFVELEKIPLTANGKIDIKGLPDPGLREQGREGANRGFTPPRNRVENTCADVWSEVLGISRNLVGIDDNFFQSGGHSLKAVTLLSRLHKELNVKIPLAGIFAAPTIRTLAAGFIESAAPTRYISIEPAPKKEYYELSSAQKRLYIIQQMEPGSIAYNLPQVIPLPGKIHTRELERTFVKLIKHHESLRTSFHMLDDRGAQKIHDPVVEFKIEYYETRERDEAGEIITNFIKPFDLGQAPLLRSGIIKIKTAQEFHLLVVDMHHIISDGISLNILSRDFTALYNGEDLPLPLLQYKDYAQWQNSKEQKEVVKQQEIYWLNRFPGKTPKLDLPADYPKPEVWSSEGDMVSFVIAAEEFSALEKMMKNRGLTLYMALLAIYNVLLSRYTGQEDIVIGAVTAGRTNADLQNIIGMFNNLLPMRNYPQQDKHFNDFLKEVKKNTLDAFENQDYQYEELIGHLDLQREAGKDPLVDAAFTVQNIFTGGEEKSKNQNENEHPQKIGTDPKEPPPPLNYGFKISKWLLDLQAIEKGNTVTMILEYSKELFKPATALLITKNYMEVLRQVTADQTLRLGDIEISHGLSGTTAKIPLEKHDNFMF